MVRPALWGYNSVDGNVTFLRNAFGVVSRKSSVFMKTVGVANGWQVWRQKNRSLITGGDWDLSLHCWSLPCLRRFVGFNVNKAARGQASRKVVRISQSFSLHRCSVLIFNSRTTNAVEYHIKHKLLLFVWNVPACSGAKQPPTRWVAGFLPGLKVARAWLTIHFHLVLRLRTRAATLLLSTHAVIAHSCTVTAPHPLQCAGSLDGTRPHTKEIPGVLLLSG